MSRPLTLDVGQAAWENACVRIAGGLIGREKNVEQTASAHFLQDRFGEGEELTIVQIPIVLRHMRFVPQHHAENRTRQ